MDNRQSEVSDMKITVLQRNIIWNDRQENLLRCSHAIDFAPGADIYILPEMFTTGFCIEPEASAEEAEGPAFHWMKAKAAETGAAIAGSVAVCSAGKFYNRFYFVRPDGSYASYDKKHLFTFGGEHRHFTAGDERVVVEFAGVRILLQICYDLRFPIWSRNHGDYDMIFYVASWPASRVEAWRTLLKARAIENQCYVVGVNRVGNDPDNEYCGGTMVIDPYGKIIASCEDGLESAADAEIDIDALEAFRARFPVLDDADRI